jgi:hypothetical protein
MDAQAGIVQFVIWSRLIFCSGQHQGDAGDVQLPGGALHLPDARGDHPVRDLCPGVILCTDKGIQTTVSCNIHSDSNATFAMSIAPAQFIQSMIEVFGFTQFSSLSTTIASATWRWTTPSTSAGTGRQTDE